MTAVVTATHRRSVVTDADAAADLLHLSTTGVLRRRLLESHLWPTVAPATRSCFIAMLSHFDVVRRVPTTVTRTEFDAVNADEDLFVPLIFTRSHSTETSWLRRTVCHRMVYELSQPLVAGQ